MIDLYRRGIWRDAKTVNVMAQACLSSGKVVAPALRFFIDPTAVNPEDDEEADQRKKKKVPLHKQVCLMMRSGVVRWGSSLAAIPAVFSAFETEEVKEAQA